MCDISCGVGHVSCAIPHVGWVTCHVRSLMWGGSRDVYDLSCGMSDVSCAMSELSRMLCHVNVMSSCVTCQVICVETWFECDVGCEVQGEEQGDPY